MRLDGFGLLVEDMGKMIRFYRDVLGFEIKEEYAKCLSGEGWNVIPSVWQERF